ncbi:hypothetical protein BU24DRAFT_64537 [Aaosphaeria arxii CBS 175.79]|uniref:C2H2-type domain-containing protein n=1 Tax=Aaosphaeria arxii CBS 175.79 TaxID=1450172 RepID=A0A6A5XA60_9PLEO|nr:uncharacterized protein BU24DRAFT_64537 [Aaosphaeria arxii CBS 175.79]KAF2009799.1 hypothetical protein BU24DRAFT_64537 [Aaosphaeria arxii CBS 175.79]
MASLKLRLSCNPLLPRLVEFQRQSAMPLTTTTVANTVFEKNIFPRGCGLSSSPALGPTDNQYAMDPSNFSIERDGRKETAIRLHCSFPQCSTTCSGHYAVGNMQRHVKQKHGEVEMLLICEVCKHEFRRGDALKNHQRESHAELGIEPMQKRGPVGKRRILEG